MKEIQLSQGKIALVDDEDYDFLMGIPWHWGTHNRSGYALHTYRKENGKQTKIAMHTVIAAIIYDWNYTGIDHKNGNRLDNRKENLRVCTAQQNNANRKTHKNNKLGLKNITWVEKKQWWEITIYSGGGIVEGKRRNKRAFWGWSRNLTEAVQLRNEKTKEIHGEYGILIDVPLCGCATWKEHLDHLNDVG